MSTFEDTCELWYNALEDDEVPTVEGPTSIETLLEARDRFEELGNERTEGVLIISIEVAREIPWGWVKITGPAVPPGHEEFDPFEEMVTVHAGADGQALILRSDAVRLDMEILEPDGVVTIDFDRGDTTDA